MSTVFGRRQLLRLGGATLVIAGTAGFHQPTQASTGRPAGLAELAAGTVTADLVVYGATSAGIMAAVQMRRMGRTALIVDPGGHVGGLTTGGLGYTDSGTSAAIGGLAAEFYRRVHAHYAGTPVTPTAPMRLVFEPHVAAEVFADLLTEYAVPVYLNARLTTVQRTGDRITGIVTDNGQLFTGPMFVDASYEGDLMAAAGVTYTVGREANSVYGETINGVQLRTGHQFTLPVDPYVVAGSPASGLLPGISVAPVARNGSGDELIQAYNFRMCLTRSADRIPFPRPDGYDPADYELLLRYVQAGYPGPFYTTHSVGGGKTDSNNNGAFSTDFIGANHAYPTATWAQRESIVAAHRTYQQGLMWFLANDPRLPTTVRSATAAWGLAADEFGATGGWPPQLYVREARRMISGYVLTERDCRGSGQVTDSVGLASYTMDSHNCQRVVVDGQVRNEGDVQVGVPGPYPISYRSIVPTAGQCANLLVPVCLSASHIAYGSIRMEPVFMILGQSAATAASLALAAGTSVQQVDVPALQARLRADGQLLSWPPGGEGAIVVDNAALGVTRAGTWLASSAIGGYHGIDYEHDDNTGKGVNRFRFTPTLPTAGAWTVQLRWTANANRASNVPVDITHDGGTTTTVVDQRGSGGQWVALGTYAFPAGTAGSVLIRTDATDGYVVADAARFVPA
ncbi:FAD-dependent oxidoreductase [Micromonospora yangpuensis]|uniref:FAD dependent oxidoreductase n=1 Tax=Micromonospora yangpuensis TaxID=683228 RepID=A0A1C6UAH4_9ACTN|nr:FAD-dependent oxidoreductase [Micromonospora yangpuensis]GGL87372.1 xanthan lyase [Micromonospora yangpuensis]SCL51090.1 FAD dependent oxidoreductase [Micromonospora yangpuensis]